MIADILAEAEEKMDAAVAHTKDEFAGIRTGRAHPRHVQQPDGRGVRAGDAHPADRQRPGGRCADGGDHPPFDKSTLHSIEKAIRDSDLGVNPAIDGTIIRCSLPELTEQRRKEYTKLAKTKAEDAKVSIRNVRRHAKDGLDKLVKDKEAGEDEVARAEKQLEDITKKRVDQIDEVLKNKESELLEI